MHANSQANEFDLTQQWLDEGSFEDAVQACHLGNFEDCQDLGECQWNAEADAAKGFEANIVDFGLGEDDLDESSCAEHAHWLNDTFMVDEVADQFIHKGVLDHCAEHGITQDEFGEAVPVTARVTQPAAVDMEAMRPFFCGLDSKTVELTFKNTSQSMVMPSSTHLQHHHKSRNPAANITCRNKDDSMDRIWS